ncbi:hypothetical protein ACIQ2D_05740 [Lysinibacillus sp. NPDC097287]|uniref:hypothetical protein n=1 Tax=Lysinibacillus sp. NPDC097287 TaxID=3364144 RepID=UPI0038298CB9
MTKRRWRLLLFAVLLLVGAFTMQFREKGEEEAITNILDHANERDALELFRNETRLVRVEGADLQQYMEKYPLSHIRDVSKKERSLFEEQPAYQIVYEIGDKPLYEVDILKVAISSELSEELQSMLFTVGENQYLIYWADEKKALEQSMNTKLLLEQFGK